MGYSNVAGDLNVYGMTTTSSLIVPTANVSTLNVTTLETVSNLSASLANVSTLNVTTLETVSNLSASLANVSTLNVYQISNLASLTLTNNLVASNALTTTNLYTTAITSNATNTNFYYDTIVVPFLNSTTLNVSSIANVQTQTIQGFGGATSLVITGNTYLSNALQTTNVIASTISSTNPITFKNKIINGNFDIWQRGTSITGNLVSGSYLADRWRIELVGSTGNVTAVTQNTFPLGTTSPANARYSLSFSMSTTSVNLVQPIESVTTFSGQQVTLSFWAKTSTAVFPTYTLRQYFGTGGSPSANVDVSIQPLTTSLGTTFTQYAYTFTLASVANKVLGTYGNDYLALIFTFPSGTYTANVAQVQLESGPLVTPFELRPLQIELGLCQRYYYQLTSPTAATVGATTGYAGYSTAVGISATSFWTMTQFPVTMRTANNFVFSNSAPSNWQLYNGGTTVAVSSLSLQTDSVTPMGVILNCGVASGLTSGNSYIMRTGGLTGTTQAYLGFSCEY